LLEGLAKETVKELVILGQRL